MQERVGHLTTVQKGSIVQALIEDNGKYKYVIAKVEHSEWIDGETFQKNFDSLVRIKSMEIRSICYWSRRRGHCIQINKSICQQLSCVLDKRVS